MSGVAGELVLRFLDDLRAAEAAASEVLAAWINVCGLDGLRGGLRAIAEREAGHAALLADRVRELGGPCTAVVAEPVRVAALARFGSPAVDDEEKLAALLARYPDDASAMSPITRIFGELADDSETCELLRLIADAEGATVGWLRAYHTGLRTTDRPETPDRPETMSDRPETMSRVGAGSERVASGGSS